MVQEVFAGNGVMSQNTHKTFEISCCYLLTINEIENGKRGKNRQCEKKHSKGVAI